MRGIARIPLQGDTLWKRASERSSQMAGTQPQAPQAASGSKPTLPKDQATNAATQAEGQPIYRDWAAI